MRIIFTITALLLSFCSAMAVASERTCFAKWSTIETTFTGPNSRGLGDPNPFAVRLDVNFTSPSGRQFFVPGFYDGDGQGGMNGNVWKVRFSADELGPWKFKTESDEKILDGVTGRFTVTKSSQTAQGFWKWGRLESVGTSRNGVRYLKFRDGPHWLKAGCDDPENLLGNYRNYNTLAKRKAAVNYLARCGINSQYIMTHNIQGDDNDVWPWVGATPEQAKKNAIGDNVRFDVARLESWRHLFEHMQTEGVVPYLILEDDSAWNGYNQPRYFRELIARFGDLPAIVFNLGEEHNENYALRDGLQMARQFKELDPYSHALGIHNVNDPNEEYVASLYVDFTAIQTGQPGTREGIKNAVQHNRIAIDWIHLCQKLGRRVLVVNFDEGRPELDRRSWWSAYLGGAVWEAHVPGPYDQPHAAWEETWSELGGTRTFMESLPFWEMQPHNELVTSGDAFCFAKPGHVYALYLPTGGDVSVNLAPTVTYDVAWWNPANGKDGRFQTHKKPILGGPQRLRAPGDADWALRITRHDKLISGMTE